jgi:hypothetical protein
VWTTIFAVWFLVFVMVAVYGAALDSDGSGEGFAGCFTIVLLYACSLACAIT